jgi:S-DNA-T family DNA segregation ATPase FtsK/SpoIIIE
MTGLLTRPTPPRRAPSIGSQGQFLEPAHQTWGWSAAALIAAAVLAVGVLALVDKPVLAAAAGVALVALAVVVAVYGVRDAQRARLVDKLLEAVSPLLGSKFNRSALRADRWSAFWDGSPGRIRLRYLAGIDDTDPRWRSEIRSQLTRRLDVEFEITKHDRKRCVLELRPSPPPAPETLRPVAVRARGVVGELLGSPAQPKPDIAMEWDGENLKALQVKHKVGVRMSRPIYRAQIERTLSTMLPGRWRARWDLESDMVRFELRSNLPAMIPHPIPVVTSTDPLETYSAWEIPYGIDEDGTVMYWAPAVNPHFLIIGTSGSGKTVTMQGVLAELAKRGARIDVNDAKLIEFLGFKSWPNVQVVAASMEEQIRLIHAAWDLQERRYELIVKGEASEEDFEPYFLFLDEFADFREAVIDWYADVKRRGDPAKPPVLKKVRSIARKGRTARVHLVVGLQRPDAEFLTGEVRDNFSARAAMGRLSPQGAQMMWENSSTGVALPRKSRGRGMTLNEDSTPVEFQSYWTPDPRKVKPDDEDDLCILEGLRPTETRHPRMMIVPPVTEPDLDSDTEGDNKEGEKGPRYSDYASARIVAYNEDLAATIRPKLTVHSGGGETAGSRRSASAKLSLVERDDEDTEEQEQEEVTGYGHIETASAESLRPGDMVLIDETLDLWCVVEAAEADILEEDRICVDYRTDDEEEGSLSLSDNDTISTRRPLDME